LTPSEPGHELVPREQGRQRQQETQRNQDHHLTCANDFEQARYDSPVESENTLLSAVKATIPADSGAGIAFFVVLRLAACTKD
jgi:hypothetical protein